MTMPITSSTPLTSSPASVPLQATDHMLVAPDGVRIHYLDAPGAGRPLVMLHGLSANAHCFAGLIVAGLSPAYRVIAPDLRGRGQSDKPSSGYTMPDHARDVLALMDHLGLDRVVLGGHSFGGYVGI